jgi:hypothetical protein
MRACLAAALLCLLAGAAQADPLMQPRHMTTRHQAPSRHVLSAAMNAVLSAPCRLAAALGGPCGCFASEFFFGRSVRSLWLADAWLSFPHVTPAAGTAAVWVHRHVAPVVAVAADGAITVHDSWATHRVPARIARRLVYVDPRGGRRRLATIW